MTTSAFGVPHGTDTISKGSVVGSLQHTAEIAHEAGKHEGKTIAECRMCTGGNRYHSNRPPVNERGVRMRG